MKQERSSSSETSNDKLPPRGEDLSHKARYKTKLQKLYQQLLDGWEDKNTRNQATERYWRIYNCELTGNQSYSGISQIYLPFVHDAIEARVQRYVNTLFPESGRYVDLVSHPKDYPHGVIGLMDHYVRMADLRTKARSLLRNGQVEGQYSLYVDWLNISRYITKKVEKHPEIEKGVYDPDDTFMDLEDERVTTGHPRVRIIMDADLLVLPATVDDIEKEQDSIVCVRHFFTEEGLKDAGDAGLLSKEAVDRALKEIKDYNPTQTRDVKKQIVGAAGVQIRAGKRCYILFEVWQRHKVDKRKRWCRMFFGGDALCFGMTVNPNWNDRCPVISKAHMKIDGSFWGKSPVDAVEQLQYAANDFANMMQDNAQFNVNQIFLTDPEKNPMYASLVMAPSAVWPVAPNDLKPLEQQQVWKESLQIVQEYRSQILQAFGLNPAMVSMGAGSRKQSQAAIAQEQMVAIAAITDEVQTVEDSIFTPLLQMFFELDQQFRDDDVTIKIFGQEGIAAKMEKVPAFAWDDRYEFSWRGSQVMRSQQANQQMISGLSVLAKLGPQLPNGKKIDIAPIIETFVENVYGPRLGARILVDNRDQLSVPPELENQMMDGGLSAEVHPMDEDPKHMQVHSQDIQTKGDLSGLKRIHLQKHQLQMQQKAMAAQDQQGGGAPGGPRPGAQAQPPRGGQNPPGAIHKDQMQDPNMQPRKGVV